MYAVGFVTVTENNVPRFATRITCLDMATGTECPGVELTPNGAFYHSGLAAVGTRLYVTPGTAPGAPAFTLQCYESTTWMPCAGWTTPKTLQAAPTTVPTDCQAATPNPNCRVYGAPVWGVRGQDGAVRNICANTQCFSLDGGSPTLPPNFLAYLATHPVVGTSRAENQSGSASSEGTKSAWAISERGATTNVEKAVCWDMVADALCPNYPITVDDLYVPVVDPYNQRCRGRTQTRASSRTSVPPTAPSPAPTRCRPSPSGRSSPSPG